MASSHKLGLRRVTQKRENSLFPCYSEQQSVSRPRRTKRRQYTSGFLNSFDASKKTFLKAYSPLDDDIIIISREIVCLNLKSHSLSRCCLLSFSSLFNSLLTKRVYSCLISHFGVLGRRRPFSRQNRLSRFVHLQLGDDTLGRVDADLHGSACDLF